MKDLASWILPLPPPTRTAEGRFAPGCSGNPKGRPIGSRNRASVMAEALEEGEPEMLIREYADIAHGGDKVALRFCVGRLVPPMRGRTIVLDLPPGTELDFRTGYIRVARAVFDGEITPDEGLKLARLLQVGKAARFFSSLPAPEPPVAETTTPETEEEEPAAATYSPAEFLRELLRRSKEMRGAADETPPGGGETGAAEAGLPAAGGDAQVASSPLPPSPEDDARAGETRAPDAPPATPSAAPPPRRIFGTIVRKPEVLAAKLAIV
jgi:hypothetical protein